MKAEDSINCGSTRFISSTTFAFSSHSSPVTDILVILVEDKRSWRESVAEQRPFVIFLVYLVYLLTDTKKQY